MPFYVANAYMKEVVKAENYRCRKGLVKHSAIFETIVLCNLLKFMKDMNDYF